MSVIRLQQENYQLEDRAMEGYAIAYHAYLARRDLPGPEPTFADFVEIRKLQGEIERLLAAENPSSLDDAYVEQAARRPVGSMGFSLWAKLTNSLEIRGRATHQIRGCSPERAVGVEDRSSRYGYRVFFRGYAA